MKNASPLLSYDTLLLSILINIQAIKLKFDFFSTHAYYYVFIMCDTNMNELFIRSKFM